MPAQPARRALLTLVAAGALAGGAVEGATHAPAAGVTPTTPTARPGTARPATRTAAARTTTTCPTPRTTAIRVAPGSGRTVALTFDDGPGPWTPAILSVLRKYGVRATFFDTGAHDAQYPAHARQIAAEGHLVADHTWDHRYPREVRGGWTARYLADQLGRTNAQQLRLTGHATCFFRPPGGYLSAGVVAAARARGMSTVMWSIDTEDWKQPAHTSTAATAEIVRAAEAGERQRHPIILMHTGKASHESERAVSSNRSNDVAALPAIIRSYLAHGYRFVDMNGRSGLTPR